MLRNFLLLPPCLFSLLSSTLKIKHKNEEDIKNVNFENINVCRYNVAVAIIKCFCFLVVNAIALLLGEINGTPSNKQFLWQLAVPY